MFKNSNQYNVCLMGASLDTGNRGVSALCASCAKIIMEIRPDSKIKLLIGNRSSIPQHLQLIDKEVLLEVINFRLSPKSKLKKNILWIFFLACCVKFIPIPILQKNIIQGNEFLREIAYADFIGDIRGGDSFSDIYGLNNLIISSLPVIVVVLLGKKLVLLPQTYGPFKTFIARKIAHYIISHAFKVCSRDLAGIDYVKKLLGCKAGIPPILFCPDVAFKLEAIMPRKINIVPPLERDKAYPLVGININGLMYNGGYSGKNMFGLKVDYNKMMLHLIEKLLEETDAHIVLIPHTFGPPGNINSDPDASYKILALVDRQHESRVHILSSEYDQSEMKGIINLCDFFIGSRMHACIAALSQGIPTVGIAYSKKFMGVFDSIGANNAVLDARALEEYEIIHHVLLSYQSRNELKLVIDSNITLINEKIETVFNELLT